MAMFTYKIKPNYNAVQLSWFC